MSEEQWYWVRDSTTRVDTSQVVQASLATNWAAESVEAAWASLGPGAGWGSVFGSESTSVSPTTAVLLEERENLAAQIQSLRVELRSTLQVLKSDIAVHAEWLSAAALIYASADSDAATYFRYCESLTAISCERPVFGGLAGAVLSVPAMIEAMGKPDPNAAQVQIMAMQTENQLRQASAFGGEEPLSTAQFAGFLSKVWFAVGQVFSPSSSGVVIVGEGKLAWGTTVNERGGTRIVQLGDFDLRLSEVQVNQSRSPSSSENDASAESLEFWKSTEHPVGLAAALATRAVNRTPSWTLMGKPPMSASALLYSLEDIPRVDGVGEIQILRHDQPNTGRHSWSVVIRGTEEWLPGSSNPQDLLSNFQEVAGRISDQHVAVLAAMDMAGIEQGDPVEFVGHSQGGAVALSVAASEEVTSRFNVVSVLTAGGPVGATPDPSVRVLALENTADIVPALDGRPSSTEGNHVVIHFDRLGYEAPPEGGAHGMPTYAEAAKALSQRAGTDPDLRGLKDWEQARIEALGLGVTGVTTTSLAFATKRTLGNIEAPSYSFAGQRRGQSVTRKASALPASQG